MGKVDLDNPKLVTLLQLVHEVSGAHAITVVFDAEPGELEEALIARNHVLSIGSKSPPASILDLPRPGGSAGADRAGKEADIKSGNNAERTEIDSAGLTTYDSAGDWTAKVGSLDDLEPGDLLRCRGFVGEIAEELTDIAKAKGIYASVSISIMLDGREEVAQTAEPG